MTSNGAPARGEGIWALSDVLPDGSYGVTVTVGPDVAFKLDRDKAIAYAAVCVSTAMRAEHQLAVLRLLTERLKLEFHLAGSVIVRDLRVDRSGDDATTYPMRFETSIGRRKDHPRTYVPLVRVLVDGDELGCLEPDDVRDHGEAVLDALASAQLDDQLFRYLTGKVELDAGKARALVRDLAEFLPAGDGREPEKG